MRAIRHVPITESVTFGWNQTLKHFGFLLTFLIIVVGIQIALGLAQGFLAAVVGRDARSLVFFVVSVVRVAINIIVAMAGLKATLIITAGKKPTIQSSFKGVTEVNLIVNYLISSFLAGLMTMVGFIFFIVPGIYFALKYSFAGYYLVDKSGSFSKALGVSSDITEGVKIELFMLGIVMGLINFLGLMLFGVGLLFTIPTTQIAKAFVYRHLMRKS